MGRGYVQYRLLDSDGELRVFFSAFFNYRLPRGDLLSVNQQPAWCSQCRTFAPAERIESVDRMEQRITELQNADARLLETLTFCGTTVANELADLTLRIEWRRRRINPPRCLHCGCSEIVPLPDHGPFPHPTTGETVIEAGRGFTDLPPDIQDFTPEGDPLSRPTERAEYESALAARLSRRRIMPE
jgi:hypothetical protein